MQGACCDNAFNNCEANAGCAQASDTCSLQGILTSCAGTASPKTLTTSDFTLVQGNGMVGFGLNSAAVFDNSAGLFCAPHTCTLYEATGAFGSCGPSLTSAATYSTSITNTDFELKISTSTTFTRYFCLSCIRRGTTAGANLITSNNFQVTVRAKACTATSQTIASPTLSTLSYSFIIQQGQLPSTSAFSSFSDGGPDSCTVTGIDIVVSSTDSTVHPDLQYDSGTLKVELKDAAKKHQQATLNFAILIHFGAGPEKYAQDSNGSKDLTLTVSCDASSTTVSIHSSITLDSTVYGANQYVPTGPHSKFFLPAATSSLASADPSTSCGVQSRTTDLEASIPPLLSAVALVPGEAIYFLKALDNTIAARHIFVYTVTAVGGASASTTLNFHFGCYPSTSFADSNLYSTQHKLVQSTPDPAILRQFQPLSLDNPNCIQQSVEPFDVKVDGVAVSSSFVSISCPPSSPCDVTTTLVDKPRTLSYKIKVTFSDNTVVKGFIPFTVHFTCNLFQTKIQLDYTSPLVVSYPRLETSNIIYFGPYDCIIPNCCDPMTHEVVDAGGNNLQFGTATNGSFTFSVDTQSVGTSVYTFKVNDGNGHSAQWDAQITIIDICPIQSTFEASSVLPIGSELRNIESFAGSIAKTASSQLQISFVIDITKTLWFELDLSQRFTSPYCPASNYRLTPVSSTGSQSQTAISAAFQISSGGVLTFKHHSGLLLNETYSLTIDIFNGHVWSSFSEPIIKIKICQNCGGQYGLPEAAPYFIEDLQSRVTVNLTEASDSFSVPLPEVFDPNGDAWEVKVSGDSAVIVDPDSNSLVVDLHRKNTTSNFTVEIIIIDANQRSTMYTCTIELLASEPVSSETNLSTGPDDQETDGEPTEEDGSEEGEEERTSKPPQARQPTAEIKAISNLGELTIVFNEPLTSIPNLVPENLDIYVLPSEGRAADEHYDPASVNLTWSVTKTEDNSKITLQLQFDYPLEISPLAVQDRLVVHFRSSLRPLLQSAATKAPLQKESWTLKRAITKQMPVSKFTKSFQAGAETVEISLKVLLIISFFLNMLSSGGMIFMLQMIRSLQIVLHFPLLRIIVPANVSMFFAYLIPIVTFDVLDPEWTTELVLNFDEEGQEKISGDILDQMKDLGYETHNSILNLGSLSIFLVIYFFKLGLYFISVGFHRWTGRGEGFKDYLRNGLFFGDLVSIVLDAYFEFIISGYLQLSQPLWSFNGEVSAMLVGAIALALALVWLPLAQIYQLTKAQKEVLNADFEDKWGTLLEGISIKSRWSRAYFLVFILRRLSFFAVAMFVNNYFEFQIIGVLALNMIYFLYLGLIAPHSYRLLNRIELLNEYLVQLCTITLLIFTEWVPDPIMQYHVGGWMTIILLIRLLAGNLFFIFQAFIQRSHLYYLKLISICKVKRQNLFSNHPKITWSSESASSEERKSDSISMNLSSSEGSLREEKKSEGHFLSESPTQEQQDNEDGKAQPQPKQSSQVPSDQSINDFTFSDLVIGSSMSNTKPPTVSPSQKEVELKLRPREARRRPSRNREAQSSNLHLTRKDKQANSGSKPVRKKKTKKKVAVSPGSPARPKKLI